MDTTNIKRFLNELTDLIAAERKVVFSVILLAMAIKFGYGWFENRSMTHLESIKIVQGNASIPNSPNYSSSKSYTTELFSFNPATVSHEELVLLGFSPKVANILINYRSKGGQFRTKDDVKKIFGVSPELYQRIEPFILIKVDNSNTFAQTTYSDKKPKMIDINIASLEEWKALPGIGDYFAKKFIEKRNGLGAYVDVDQIAEVYNFPDSTYQKIKPFIKISKGTIRKININTAKEEELRQHPYILRWQADDIIRNRPIYGLEDLYDLKTYNDKSKNKYVNVYFEF